MLTVTAKGQVTFRKEVLETLRDYPAAVKTLLGRHKRIRLDRLLNRLL